MLNDVRCFFSQGNNYQIELNKVNGSFGFNVMVSVIYYVIVESYWHTIVESY